MEPDDRRRAARTRSDRTAARELLDLHPQATRWEVTAVALGAAAAVLLIIWTLLLARVIDRVFISGADLAGVTPEFIAMAGLLAVRAACIWGAEVSGQRASGHVRGAVRTTLARHLVEVGPTGLSNERVGEISTTVGHGVDSLDGYITAYLPSLVLAGVVPLSVFLTIGALDPWTTLILVFAGPMLILLLAVIGGRTRELSAQRFRELGWLSSFYLDMIRGLPTLKAFGRAGDGAETIGEVSKRHGDATMEVLRTAFQTSLVMEWAATAATALVAVQVSFRLITDRLSFGTALAVLMLTPEFFAPLRRLALEYHAGQSGGAAMARIAEIRSLPTLVAPSAAHQIHEDGTTDTHDPSHERGTVAVPSSGPIEFSAVAFTYPGSHRQALRALDLHIDHGETVALVGASGAGKSTVANLLMRFIEPNRGTITIAGVPLPVMDPAAWRRHVAWVPQDPAIFTGTVAANIRLGRPTATADQVRRAARAARAEDFIETLPAGFDTVLGEQGLRLSGGQRQRLAIARAAIRDAPFVVLDEFTAHLDEETEADVLAAILGLIRDRTALVIAHRTATIDAADRVVTLDRGQITGQPR